MTEIITLAEAKAQLRVAGSAEDTLIGRYIVAAVGAVENELGRPLIDPVRGWGAVEVLPPSVVQAVLLLLSHFYENRELGAAPVDRVVLGMLLDPYKRPSLA